MRATWSVRSERWAGKGVYYTPGPDILTVLHIVAWRGNSHAATYPMLMSVQFSSLFYNF